MTNHIVRYFLIIALFFICVFAEIAFAGHKWMDFLRNPTGTTSEALIQRLNACNKTDKCMEAKPDSEEVYKLIALIKSGNPYAVDVAFFSLNLDLFDGGELGDVVRSLGQLAEINPKLLLRSLKRHGIIGYPFENIMIILPLEAVDDSNAKIRTVQKRIDSISTVNDPSLINERDQAILVLKRRLAQLQERKEP